MPLLRQSHVTRSERSLPTTVWHVTGGSPVAGESHEQTDDLECLGRPSVLSDDSVALDDEDLFWRTPSGSSHSAASRLGGPARRWTRTTSRSSACVTDASPLPSTSTHSTCLGPPWERLHRGAPRQLQAGNTRRSGNDGPRPSPRRELRGRRRRRAQRQPLSRREQKQPGGGAQIVTARSRSPTPVVHVEPGLHLVAGVRRRHDCRGRRPASNLRARTLPRTAVRRPARTDRCDARHTDADVLPGNRAEHQADKPLVPAHAVLATGFSIARVRTSPAATAIGANRRRRPAGAHGRG